jgi:hypothetical protein
MTSLGIAGSAFPSRRRPRPPTAADNLDAYCEAFGITLVSRLPMTAAPIDACLGKEALGFPGPAK